MKKAGLLFLVLFISLASKTYSETVPESVAVKAAQNFFIQKTEQKWPAVDAQVSGIYTQKHGNQNLFYIVSFQSRGFVITSADDRFQPVLAWSDNGNFPVKDIPDACSEWLNWYEAQILSGLRNPLLGDQSNPEKWNELLKTEDGKKSRESLDGVTPLLTGKWHQTAFYNQLCPEEPAGYDGHVPVGCVATAMSQVMYYYRFPAHGKGSYAYTPPYGNGKYGLQSADFENTTYLWNEMTDICLDPNQAVAQLCYHAGVALHTDYTPIGSGADTEDVPFALSTYFNYSDSAVYHYRLDFETYAEWQNLLIGNLEKNQPVVYRSTNGLSGHAYVCDGYQDSTHFHFNWGWGGNCDGYYFIDELIPGGLNLSWAQGAVFNIYPNTANFTYPEYCTEPAILTNTLGSLEDGSGPENYAPNSSCSWLIQPSDPTITNMFISFSFFKTQPGDVLTFYDGASINSPVIGTFSGLSLPERIYTPTNSLFITFETDTMDEESGWHLNFAGYTLPFCDDLHTFNDRSGTLEDGSRYLDYAPGTDCNWLIDPEIPDDDSIRNFNIEFRMLKLATGDTLTIYDGNSPASNILGKFTGYDIPETLSTSSDKVFLNFKSDENQESDGWTIDLLPQSPVYCRDTIILSSENGIISDGSGSKKYIENSDCGWLVKAQDAESIHFEFLELDFEVNYDYLQFSFSESGVNKQLRFTGDEIPAPLTLYSDSVFILFHSDYRDNFQGFKFQYDAAFQSVNENMNQELCISPNPFSATFQIRLNNPIPGIIQYQILDINGKPLFFGVLENGAGEVEMKDMTKGVYFLRIYTQQATYVKKIIKL